MFKNILRPFFRRIENVDFISLYKMLEKHENLIRFITFHSIPISIAVLTKLLPQK